MTHTPEDVATYLVERDGIEGAMRAALEGALEAQAENDNYALSLWREVKSHIRSKAAETDAA